ncbi:(Fe-S)-binding protein [Candidatus Solincola tengchongensis]|uniref:(Fe-S)-binding protein n=1 Tax=Candidatus Solincola tengchongensis TaxID=2900693 RepID=UPI002579508C|nr:(Fe-S)-binding protein [Candidatus Solincola tengchongensis]
MCAEELDFITKYDLLGCIQCGRCTGGCPVAMRTPLRVRCFMYDTQNQERLEELSERPEIWDCTTCYTCAARCPKGLEPLEVLIGLRSIQIEEGRVQPTVRDALESIFRDGNPWGSPRAKRLDWVKDLEVKVLEPEAEETTDVLLFICCTDAYDPRVMKVAQSLVKVLQAAGVDFGLIGEDESCCGSEVRRLGEEGLFEMCDEENVELLNSFNVNRIVAISPHCYNTLKKEYHGLKHPVLHYTELVAQLLEDGKLQLKGELPKVVTYHDPCFLGKQNDIYDEPRYIITRIPGVEFREFDRCRERSLCCEGGGGKMWVESESKEERLAEIRVTDAKELGAEVIAVACPFCLLTLEDATKVKGIEEEMRVADILELLAEAL